MALITCPHCGNQVSDTVERCIHCGEPLLKEEAKPTPTDFHSLEKDNQNSIEKEFQKKYPSYVCFLAKQNSLKCRRKIKILNRISFIAGIIFFLFFILVSTKVLDLNNDDTMLMIVMPIVLVVALVIFICMGFKIYYLVKSKKSICRYLLYEKLFQAWLLRAKNISMSVDFSDMSKKDMKYFENINPGLYLEKGE